MAETVSVTESQGARYTWANASFTWASASAGKSWLTAYPAVYVVAVAATLAWGEATGRRHGKRLAEGVSLAEERRHQAALQKAESLGFADTYYDLIAYVLRWVESLGVAESVTKAGRKSLHENLQTLDSLAQYVTKAVQEGLPVTEGLARRVLQEHGESLPMASVSARQARKAFAEGVGLTDRLEQGFSKRITEALNFAETYYDLIAFILRIGEGLALSDQASRKLQKPVAEALSTSDQLSRQSVKQVVQALAFAENFGRTVAYKRLLHEWLGVSDGINVPKILDRQHLTFPCFAKPYDGSRSVGAAKLSQAADLSDGMRDDPKLMFMEFIDQTFEEYTVDAYYDRMGVLKCLVPRHRLEVRDGEINKGVTRKHHVYEYLVGKLAKINGARGCLTVQLFAHLNEKRYAALEINPRFGGGFPLSYAAGANYPGWLIDEYLLHKEIVFSDSWTPNLMMLRYDAHVLVSDAR